MKTYKKKTILITGASAGIGEAMARRLVDPSVTLLLTARSEDKLNTLADQIKDRVARVAVYPLDLSEPGAASELYWKTVEGGYSVDVLVNNAGYGKQGHFDDYDASTYENMVTLNVTNLVALTRLCLPAMLQKGECGILNVASTAAYQAVPGMAVYAATKAFVLSFSEALHHEYGRHGISVTCLAPGPTETGFQDMAEMRGFTGLELGQTADDVAREGLKALLRNDISRVSGMINRTGAVASRFLPRRAVAYMAGKLYGPR
jgi:uncharacterized protein